MTDLTTTVSVTVRNCVSMAELKQSMERANSPTLIIGEHEENPREFTLLDISREMMPLGVIGIASYGVGVRPQHVMCGTKMMVGYNHRIAVIECIPFALSKQVDLLSLFWEFISLPTLPGIVALCETAVLAVSDSGTILWRHDVDLVKTHRVFGQELFLTFDDSPACWIDLLSGVAVKGS